MTLIKRGTEIRDLPEPFLRLLNRLRAFRVSGWDFDSDGPTWPKLDREAAGLIDADVASSEIRVESTGEHWLGAKVTHVLALDIDWPAYLVESSTEGHHHLYIDVPGGIPHETYMKLLDVLAEAKVIQTGYAKVSKERGHSDLRLPWVAKTSPYAEPVVEMTPQQAAQIDTAVDALVPPPVPSAFPPAVL